MIDFSVIAGNHTACAKFKMKGYYDWNAGSELSFSPVPMILVCTPGLSSKFTDSWVGPFEFLRQVTPVTWEILVTNTRKKTCIIHTKIMMKPWHTAEARVCRVVVATEDDDPDPPTTKSLIKSQLSALRDILFSFSLPLIDAPGSNSLMDMFNNTGDALPFQSVPYHYRSHFLALLRILWIPFCLTVLSNLPQTLGPAQCFLSRRKMARYVNV